MLCLLTASAAGFYFPNLVLARLAKAYQRKIFEGFPDALDLLIVCLEAGLALDAAMVRVARELAANAPEVSEELQLVTLELRAGSSREKALRNLAARTRVAGIDTLVAMLIQANDSVPARPTPCGRTPTTCVPGAASRRKKQRPRLR